MEDSIGTIVGFLAKNGYQRVFLDDGVLFVPSWLSRTEDIIAWAGSAGTAMPTIALGHAILDSVRLADPLVHVARLVATLAEEPELDVLTSMSTPQNPAPPGFSCKRCGACCRESIAFGKNLESQAVQQLMHRAGQEASMAKNRAQAPEERKCPLYDPMGPGCLSHGDKPRICNNFPLHVYHGVSFGCPAHAPKRLKLVQDIGGKRARVALADGADGPLLRAPDKETADLFASFCAAQSGDAFEQSVGAGHFCFMAHPFSKIVLGWPAHFQPAFITACAFAVCVSFDAAHGRDMSGALHECLWLRLLAEDGHDTQKAFLGEGLGVGLELMKSEETRLGVLCETAFTRLRETFRFWPKR